MAKFGAVLVLLLGLPAYLLIYNPSMQLGGLGLVLGGIGYTISPLILLGCLIYTAVSLWRK